MTTINLHEIAAKMKYTVLVECPVCDHADYQPILVGRHNCVICRCNNCGIVFLNPRPAKSGKSEYSPGHAVLKYIPRMVKLGFLSAELVPNLPKLYHRYRKLVDMTSMLNPEFPVLDIGCGIGLSMLAMRHKGIASTGIDVNDEFIQVACQTFGLDVRKCDVEVDQMRPLAKMATLNAVLEHIERPVEFLAAIRRNILAADAHLVVTIPNLASLQFLREGGEWEVLSGGHAWYPTEQTAAMVARRAGFEVEYIYREPDKPSADHLQFFVRQVLESKANLTGGIGMILRPRSESSLV